MDITPEQKEQLTTWSAQRDEAIRLLSVVNNEVNEKQAELRSVSESLKDAETRLIEIKSAIQVLSSDENSRGNLISKELSDLKEEKVSIQTEVKLIKDELEDLKVKRDAEVLLLDNLTIANARVKEQTEGLKGTIDYVVKNTEKSVEAIHLVTSNLKKKVSEISLELDSGTTNLVEKISLFSDTTIKQIQEKLKEVFNKEK